MNRSNMPSHTGPAGRGNRAPLHVEYSVVRLYSAIERVPRLIHEPEDALTVGYLDKQTLERQSAWKLGPAISASRG